MTHPIKFFIQHKKNCKCFICKAEKEKNVPTKKETGKPSK